MSYEDLFNFTTDREMFDVCQISSPNSITDEQGLREEENEDVFSGIVFDCPSELNSPSDTDSKQSDSFEKPVRKQLIIGKHIKLNEDGPHKFTCTVCNCNFSRKQQVRYHDYCVTGKRPLKCDLCGKGFVKKSHLIYHVRTHTGESPYECSICKKGFKQKAKLKRHEKTHNKDETSRLLCSTCNKSFSDKDSLKKHEQKHLYKSAFPCSGCKKSYADKFTLKQHMEIHKNPAFICDVCGKTFMRKNSLNVHMQIHDDIYPFECDSCHKTFRSKKELVQHNVVHNKDNPGHECNICSITCGRRDNLLRHIRNCHLDPCQKKTLKGTKESSSSNKKTEDKQAENEKQDTVLKHEKSNLENTSNKAATKNAQGDEVPDKKSNKVKGEMEKQLKKKASPGSSRLVVKLFPPKEQKKRSTTKSVSHCTRSKGEVNSVIDTDSSAEVLQISSEKVPGSPLGDASKNHSEQKESHLFKELNKSGNILLSADEESQKVGNVEQNKNAENKSGREKETSSSLDMITESLPLSEEIILNSSLNSSDGSALARASVLVSTLKESSNTPNSFDEGQSTSSTHGSSHASDCANHSMDEKCSISDNSHVETLPLPKSSVIFHTDEFRALVLAANASREPVIKMAKSSVIENDRKALQFKEPP